MHNFVKNTIMTIALTIIPATLFAATPITIEGTFQGAHCVFYNEMEPDKITEGHIATEPDFVFVYEKGEPLFVSNLAKDLKKKFLNSPVKISGKKKGDSLRAEILEVKKDGEYKKVWSLEKEEAEKRRMNRK